MIDKDANDAITEEELKDHINFMQKRSLFSALLSLPAEH